MMGYKIKYMKRKQKLSKMEKVETFFKWVLPLANLIKIIKDLIF